MVDVMRIHIIISNYINYLLLYPNEFYFVKTPPAKYIELQNSASHLHTQKKNTRIQSVNERAQ